MEQLLDEDEKTMLGASHNEHLLKLVADRNRARDELKDFNENIGDLQQKELQKLQQTINELAAQIAQRRTQNENNP